MPLNATYPAVLYSSPWLDLFCDVSVNQIASDNSFKSEQKRAFFSSFIKISFCRYIYQVCRGFIRDTQWDVCNVYTSNTRREKPFAYKDATSSLLQYLFLRDRLEVLLQILSELKLFPMKLSENPWFTDNSRGLEVNIPLVITT